MGPGTFRVHGEIGDLDRIGWNGPERPALWRYHQHYFDDLRARDAAAREAWQRSLMERWIRENPPGRGVGWDSYPTSLRIANWVRWGLTGRALPDTCGHSLAVQARWLRGRLEHHLLGNHLWANAKALVFAGAWFEGREADAWHGTGMDLLRRELAEQILPDGGHFERSPMYHSVILSDLLDLLHLDRCYPGRIPAMDVEAWRTATRSMLRWLRVMTHPDGGIAQFNDAALGQAPDLASLVRNASSLGLAEENAPLADIEPLPESGFVRLEAGPAVLIADVGEIGPDHLPGHAHADTLSFELSLHGRRVLVNGGTSTYERGPERLRQRGTATHNTVMVDGEDSSEVWASFRVARRARPSGVRWWREGDALLLEASHDGYRRLPGRVTHRRRWILRADGLTVADFLDGSFAKAEANYLLPSPAGPDGDPEGEGGAGALKWKLLSRGTLEPVPRTWHPGFGTSLPGRGLRLRFAGPEATLSFHWPSEPVPPAAPPGARG